MGIEGANGEVMVGEVIRLNVDPSNRRAQFRRTVIKGARIIFNDGMSTLNCRVRDMTAGGARLDLSTQQLLPHEFELQVSGSTIRRCGLRWAHGTFVGVHFLPDAAV